MWADFIQRYIRAVSASPAGSLVIKCLFSTIWRAIDSDVGFVNNSPGPCESSQFIGVCNRQLIAVGSDNTARRFAYKSLIQFSVSFFFKSTFVSLSIFQDQQTRAQNVSTNPQIILRLKMFLPGLIRREDSTGAPKKVEAMGVCCNYEFWAITYTKLLNSAAEIWSWKRWRCGPHLKGTQQGGLWPNTSK